VVVSWLCPWHLWGASEPWLEDLLRCARARGHGSADYVNEVRCHDVAWISAILMFAAHEKTPYGFDGGGPGADLTSLTDGRQIGRVTNGLSERVMEIRFYLKSGKVWFYLREPRYQYPMAHGVT